MQLHELISVTETVEEGTYIAIVDITDDSDQREVVEYASREGDPHGIAPVVRAAIVQWIADGKPVAPYVEPEPKPVTLPPLTARQLRLGLVTNGITLASVEATIAAIEDEQDRAVAEIEWQYASQFDRDHPLIEQVGGALGLSVEQIDTMWQSSLEL